MVSLNRVKDGLCSGIFISSAQGQGKKLRIKYSPDSIQSFIPTAPLPMQPKKGCPNALTPCFKSTCKHPWLQDASDKLGVPRSREFWCYLVLISISLFSVLIISLRRLRLVFPCIQRRECQEWFISRERDKENRREYSLRNPPVAMVK